jgi:hypothetical protein
MRIIAENMAEATRPATSHAGRPRGAISWDVEQGAYAA